MPNDKIRSAPRGILLSMSKPRSYDLGARFSAILYSIGVFAGFVVVSYYLSHISEIDLSQGLPFISYRNYLTTMVLKGTRLR